MHGIIKRTNKWVEQTRARKKRTKSIGSTGGVASGTAQSTAATSTIVATSTSAGPTQSIGGGGDQPPKKNVLITPTRGGGSLPNTEKVGDKEKSKMVTTIPWMVKSKMHLTKVTPWPSQLLR